MRLRSSCAAASAGLICPPVPPAAKITLIKYPPRQTRFFILDEREMLSKKPISTMFIIIDVLP